jgi:protein gp37
MAGASDIEWTDMTWNPVTGCTKISQGCKHCYAERMSKRLRAMGVERYRDGFSLRLHPDVLAEPSRWTGSRRVFVNSMSDLFHKDVPLEFIARVFDTIASNPRHTFQILTKRAGRLAQVAGSLPWPPNLWMGTSVEHARTATRIGQLRAVPAAVRFLSLEPLLGPLDDLELGGIHWVIVGGESGPGARPMEPVWVESILAQCREAGVPFFFKQWGGVRKKKTGRELRGRTYDEFPALAASI